MRKLLLLALIAFGCESGSDVITSGDLTTTGMIATWQATNATLALTPHAYPTNPAFVYVAPNGAVVLGSYRVDGSSLLLDSFPPATFLLNGDMLTVTLPTGMTTYTRAAAYCIPSSTAQSCQ